MNTPQVAACGSWQSPITSNLIVSQTVGISSLAVNQGNIYWVEKRPQEQGRNLLIGYGNQTEVKNFTPAPLSVRSKIHEYGGGAFVVEENTIYFSNYQDGRIYQQVIGTQPYPLTDKLERRYGDLIVDRDRNRLICVCEDHSLAGEAKNSIVTINLNTGRMQDLVAGSDFYSSPRLSPDGEYLAWLSWNHPNMPWDSTHLWLAQLDAEGMVLEPKLIAGGTAESICEPKWGDDGTLYFSSDRTNWWNLYRRKPDGQVEILQQKSAEFAYPHWIFGLSTYAVVGESIICAYSADGCWHLGKIDLKTKQFSEIKTRYTNISDLQGSDDFVIFIGGSPTETTAVIKLDLNTLREQILRRTGEVQIDPGYLSLPEAIAFPSSEGLTAHAWYYAPENKDYLAMSGELPPLIVNSHGGPTAAAAVELNLRIQYWTSRGFGYLDVNYGGSIGYGRQYRQRLDGKWGIVDVDDCINAAKYLVERKSVDGDRLVITGSSAGGYTTLAALTFRDTFKAGASYYGVSDLEILAKDTHKFESRYLDRLVGKYPEDRAIYQERSPIYFIEQLDCPVIFFQGLKDQVVPPNQAEMMFEAIKKKGLPVAYIAFEQEAHGFRIAENIQKALDSEFYFYSRIFGFEPADRLEQIEIINL
ncbi:peptidase [Pleurocapsa sp. CCALA 161]|uniref:S9 family peptidase n=1 Tax=Pleurocapsa sp. CCALA 161 TaxID=2107688 RepID=UPI000D0731C3|nr:S9 family peptidase [Pleurocapsa sp. CCALA 161]PSB12099.1 peptidase [Pleurocapsa sp. CCALA 161]